MIRGLTEDEQREAFGEILERDLESWFTSGIACCDKCLDDFVESWPAVYSRNITFSSCSIPFDVFYHGSRRVRECYTEEEFERYIKYVHCPRCGEPLEHNLYPYELPFQPPADFEPTVKELQELMQSTPFLVLTHPFAELTLNTIKKLYEESKPETIEGLVYRGRCITEAFAKDYSQFLAPPKARVSDNRYNHAGLPALYLSFAKDTCYYEMDCPSELWIAEFSLTGKWKILNLNTEGFKENDVLEYIVWSSLASSPIRGEGFYQPAYYFTRFISDCCKLVGFDAIRYPSVRVGERDNLVILSPARVTEEQIKRIELMKKPTKLSVRLQSARLDI